MGACAHGDDDVGDDEGGDVDVGDGDNDVGY